MDVGGELQLNGKTATGFHVRDDIVDGLGTGKRPAVRVTFRDYSYRTTIAPMSGAYSIGVSDEHRDKSGAAAGDILDATVEVDDAPRRSSCPTTSPLPSMPRERRHCSTHCRTPTRTYVPG